MAKHAFPVREVPIAEDWFTLIVRVYQGVGSLSETPLEDVKQLPAEERPGDFVEEVNKLAIPGRNEPNTLQNIDYWSAHRSQRRP